MKHQQEIIVQRLNNAQTAMKAAIDSLIGLQYSLRNTSQDKETYIEEVEEIIDFLRWASQQ
jgi:heme oxygenase